MAENRVFVKGDWVVHVSFGIGQVVAFEKKRLGKNEILYYRIEGVDGTFWLPVNKTNPERVRLIVTRKEMRKALQALDEPPQELRKNHQQRRNQIKDVLSSFSIIPVACLVRDLHFTQTGRKLNVLEEETFEKLEKHLIKEWSLVLNIQPQEARMQLRDMLANNLP